MMKDLIRNLICYAKPYSKAIAAAAGSATAALIARIGLNLTPDQTLWAAGAVATAVVFAIKNEKCPA